MHTLSQHRSVTNGRMRSPRLSVYLSGVTERVGEPELGAALAKFGLEEALTVQELAHKTLA